MMSNSSSKLEIIAIFGPTGSGKTKTALNLADENTLLISVDSRKAIKELNIGTNKAPLLAAANKITTPILGINIFDINEPTNVASYLEHVIPKTIELIKQRGITRIVLFGGTGLYMSSLLDPSLISYAPPSPRLRAALQNRSVPQLQKLLRSIAPKLYEHLSPSDKHNPHRLIRKIEIVRHQSQLQNARTNATTDIPRYLQNWSNILKHSNTVLYTVTHLHSKVHFPNRLTKRVLQMLNSGWLEEIAQILLSYNLLGTPLNQLPTSLLTLGYKQILNTIALNQQIPSTKVALNKQIKFIQNNSTVFKQLVEQITQSHLKYTKYQLSWGRRYLKPGILPQYIRIVPLNAPITAGQLVI